MSQVTFSGGSLAMHIAALEVEATNQQQQADKATRNAAREAKLAEMKAEELALREQADAIMQEAIIGGALRMSAGASKFAAGANQLDAKDQQPDATWTLISDGCNGAAYVSENSTKQRCKDLEGDAAQHKRLAEQAQATIDDQSDRIRRREDQFAQKLGTLEDTMKSAYETERVIIRG